MIIFIFITSTMFTIFQQSHGFEVNQPRVRLVNPDGSASINCEHTAKVASVIDARLNSLSPKGENKTLCQTGRETCGNVIMHQRNPNSCLFILLHVAPADLSLAYECEFTVKDGELDVTMAGKPTTLLPGKNESACAPQTPAPPKSPRLSWKPLDFALIGLLVLLLLYSSIVTFTCVKHRGVGGSGGGAGGDPENSTYVEMRKAPPPVNAHLDSYYR